jgi:hypothetical protein
MAYYLQATLPMKNNARKAAAADHNKVNLLLFRKTYYLVSCRDGGGEDGLRCHAFCGKDTLGFCEYLFPLFSLIRFAMFLAESQDRGRAKRVT